MLSSSINRMAEALSSLPFSVMSLAAPFAPYFSVALAAAVLTGIVIFHANPGWLMLSTIPFGIAAISLRDRLAAKKQEEPKS